MVAVINIDAYPFMVFSDLTSHVGDTGINCFLIALCCLIERGLNMEVVTKASPSEIKKHWCSLVCPYSYFQWFGYSRVSFVVTNEFSMRVNKIT